METAKLGGAVFLGIKEKPATVHVNGLAQESWTTYNQTSQTLTIKFPGGFDASKPFEIEYN